jgi:hypothetical protein
MMLSGCQRADPIAALGGWTGGFFEDHLYCACYIALKFPVKQNKGLSWKSFEISESDLTASMVCSTKITEFFAVFLMRFVSDCAQAFGRKE